MLIRTKIKAPSLRSPMLLRRDLIQRLCAAEGAAFVLISGPAGSGKTSLACQWLKKVSLRAAWYSLDQADNEPDLFYRYLLESFILADKALKRPFGPMLGHRQQLDGDFVIPHIVESLSVSERRIQLVLDDFHYIQNEDILNGLTRLIQYMPSCLQLIILSRYRLPASIDAVAIKRERLEISDSDLKFSEMEITELYVKIHPVSLSTQQIRELNRHVEGWAAGLQLIGLEAKSKGDDFDLSKVLTQAHEQVAGYLVHDILNPQPEDVRDFVIATALLDRFNAEMCAEVTGQENAAGLLARIADANIFLVPLDTHGNWYRYHHMFSGVVRHRMSIDDPDSIPATLRKASQWFAANGYIEDAMRNAFKSGDFEFTADLMEDHIDQYMVQLNPKAGVLWISRLPADILNQRILLGLHQCLLLLMLMEFSKLRDVLTTIESRATQTLKRYSGDKRTLCKDYMVFHKCMLEIADADLSVDVFQFQALGSKISPQNSWLSRSIEVNIVYALIHRADFSMAEAVLARVSEMTVTIDLMIKRIYYDKARVLIAINRGQLHGAEAIIRKALQDFNRQGVQNTSMVFLLHRHLGHIFYLQNRLAEAQECADLAFRYCENSELLGELAVGNELRMLLHLAAGRKKEAAEWLKQLRIFSVECGAPNLPEGLDVCAARFAVEQGNLAPAVVWSQRRKLKADEPFSLLFGMECLTQARLYYAQGKYMDAHYLLEVLRYRSLKRDLMDLVLHIDILRCAISHALNDCETAKSILMGALITSEAEGYVRPFVNDAEHIAPVLKVIAKEACASFLSAHMEIVFSACHIPMPRSIASNGDEIALNRGLTQREIEILGWIAQGCQNKKIAQKTSVSINTVKTHVHRILSKLDVRTRTQAIIKARAMNIIS